MTKFRSECERRVDDTLRRLGVVAEYEPEVVNLGDGTRYTPDWRTDLGWWIEFRDFPVEPKKAYLLRKSGERVAIIRQTRRGVARLDTGEGDTWWTCAACSAASFGEWDACCSDAAFRFAYSWPVELRAWDEVPRWWPTLPFRRVLGTLSKEGDPLARSVLELPWGTVQELANLLATRADLSWLTDYAEETWLHATGLVAPEEQNVTSSVMRRAGGNCPADMSPFAWATYHGDQTAEDDAHWTLRLERRREPLASAATLCTDDPYGRPEQRDPVDFGLVRDA